MHSAMPLGRSPGEAVNQNRSLQVAVCAGLPNSDKTVGMGAVVPPYVDLIVRMCIALCLAGIALAKQRLRTLRVAVFTHLSRR